MMKMIPTSSATKSEYTNVVIVGAGVAGTSSLYHLLPFTNDILILDAGTAPGQGDFDTTTIKSTTTTSTGNMESSNDDSILQQQQQQQQQSRYSGTAVFMDNNNIKNTTSSLNSTTTSNTMNVQNTDHLPSPSPSTTTTTTTQDADADAATSHNDISSSESKIIKMMVQIFACSIHTFILHHGIVGAQIYLNCTRNGLQIQKHITKELCTTGTTTTTSTTIIHELGSLYVAYKDDVDELRNEYNQFVSLLGIDLFDNHGIEWYEVDNDDDDDNNNINSTTTATTLYNSDKSHSITLSESNPFHAAIYFKNDAIIDSSYYSKLLLQYAIQKCTTTTTTTVTANDTTTTTTACCSNSSNQQQQQQSPTQVRSRMNTIVTSIERLSEIHLYPYDNDSNNDCNNRMQCYYSAIVTCYNNITQQYTCIYCRHVIVAIGGLSIPQGCCIEDLYGIIRPCYSYLAHVPMLQQPMKCIMNNDSTSCSLLQQQQQQQQSKRSPNFFTWNFTHDWCYTDIYHIRISGEDHYSARKDTQLLQRCKNLIHWTYQQYNNNNHNTLKTNNSIKPTIGAMDDTIDDDTKNKNDVKDSGNNNLEQQQQDDDMLLSTIPQQSGVYTETPDYAPVVGCIESDTNNTICYIVGCNAWGQTILSYAATLVPAILGYRPMTPIEHDAMKVLSIQRFQHSIAVPIRPPDVMSNTNFNMKH